MTSFTRYAIRVTYPTDPKAHEYWISIGTGVTPLVQEAHLITRRDLAEKKLAYYLDKPQWYASAEIVEFAVAAQEST